MRNILTSTCGCICVPCGEGTRLCPTNNICIDNKDWCNGVKDCADDETDCTTTVITTLPPPTTGVSIIGIKPCPLPKCPPEYKVVFKNITNTKAEHWEKETLFTTHNTKGPTKKPIKSGIKTGVKTTNRKPSNTKNPPRKPQKLVKKECPEFECVSTKPIPTITGQNPEPCPEVLCPEGYILQEYDISTIEIIDPCLK